MSSHDLGRSRSRSPTSSPHPLAAEGPQEHVPELLSPEHVDQEVCRGVDAGGEVGDGDGRVYELGAATDGGAVTDADLVVAETLVDVSDDLDRLKRANWLRAK